MWKDSYSRKAKDEGLRARSAYKLLQMNQRYHFIQRQDDVLDLGCWPGGWLLALKKLTSGRIVGVDMKRLELIPGVEFIQGDVREVQIGGMFRVVLSDMAPNTTGMKELDAARSADLAILALEVAKKHLVVEGNFVVKIFQGEDFDAFLKEVKKYFKQVKAHKPEASRSKSKEIYVVALGYQAF